MSRSSLMATRRGPVGRLGSVTLAGRIEGGRGIPTRAPRRFSCFALMYVFGGHGRYRDDAMDVPLRPGNVVTVVPGRPHWYGVTGQGSWDEAFLAFEGPVFSLALSSGLIDPARPVTELSPVPYWLHRLDSFRTRRPPRTAAGRDDEACDVLRLLADLSAVHDRGVDSGVGDWFTRSQELLESDLGEPLDLAAVAESVGLSYESWRRQFRARAGSAPGRFRLLRRVDAAATLLTGTALPTKDVATALGFCDEHHLIRHFRAVVGVTPRQFRDARS